MIGDTPRDIHAAQAAGCSSIGVTTGNYDRDALTEACADHVIDTLEEELPLG